MKIFIEVESVEELKSWIDENSWICDEFLSASECKQNEICNLILEKEEFEKTELNDFVRFWEYKTQEECAEELGSEWDMKRINICLE